MSEFWSDFRALNAFLSEWEGRHTYDAEQTVRRADLVGLMSRRRGAYPLGIISRTVPSKLRQKMKLTEAMADGHFPEAVQRALLVAEKGNLSDATRAKLALDCPYFRPVAEGSRKQVCTLYKLASINGFVNMDYQRAVNKRREQEGRPADFEAAEHAWAFHRCDKRSPRHVANCPPCIMDHKDGGHTYIQLFGRSSKMSRYVEQGTGQVVDPALVTPFLSKSKSSRQGLDNELFVNTYRLDHVVELHLGVQVEPGQWQKHRYIVQDNIAVSAA